MYGLLYLSIEVIKRYSIEKETLFYGMKIDYKNSERKKPSFSL